MAEGRGAVVDNLGAFDACALQVGVAGGALIAEKRVLAGEAVGNEGGTLEA